MTTTTKLASAKSAEQMQSLLATHAGSIYAEPHPLGVEVRDLRPLLAHLATPIKGKGVLRWFGDTHMVISTQYAKKLVLSI